MRILYINTLYAPDLVGGAERVLQAQVEAMRDAGHEVAVLTIGSNRGLQRTEINGIPVWRAGLHNIYRHQEEMSLRRKGTVGHAIWHLIDSYNPRMKPYVDRVIDVYAPQVVSCHNLPGWSIGCWDAIAKRAVPIVQVLHDQYLLCARSNMFNMEERCLSRCLSCTALRLPHRRKSQKIDTVVGVSRFILEKLRARGYFMDCRREVVIPNILDASAEALPRKPREDNLVTFGYMGRLTSEKGVEQLLETFVATRKNNWRLRLAGSGEAHFVAKLKLRFECAAIEFLGTVGHQEFYPTVDFTVVPSLWEDTFPSVAYESLIYGVPVIGSHIGGIPEIVGDGLGLLFDPDDSHSLAASLELAALEIEEFRRNFDLIKGRASKFRDKVRWLNAWIDVYHDAITSTTASGIADLADGI